MFRSVDLGLNGEKASDTSLSDSENFFTWQNCYWYVSVSSMTNLVQWLCNLWFVSIFHWLHCSSNLHEIVNFTITETEDSSLVYDQTCRFVSMVMSRVYRPLKYNIWFLERVSSPDRGNILSSNVQYLSYNLTHTVFIKLQCHQHEEQIPDENHYSKTYLQTIWWHWTCFVKNTQNIF